MMTIKKNLLSNLAKQIFKCDKCSDLRKVTPIPYPHIFFCNSPDILCIGRNPGLQHDYSEVKIKEFYDLYHARWLDSHAGKYMLKNFGENFVFNRMIWCNVCKCSSPNNRTLTKEEVSNCKIFLKKQFKIIKPRMIIAFGCDAFGWISDEFGVCLNSNFSSCVGKTFKLKGIDFIPLFHYAFLRYRNDGANIIKQLNGIKSIKKALNG